MGGKININEMSLKGLHSQIEKIFLSFKIEKNSKILILGCGEGAAESWLIKNNYKNITSVDYYTENKLKKKINFKKINLNEKDFFKKIDDKFDVVICIEIIEHLDDVNSFLFNISNLVTKNSKVIISTPNLHSKLSRIDYLLTGYPTLFISKPNIGGHVNPIMVSIFKHYCKINNFRVKKIYGYGSILNYLKAYKKIGLKSYIYLFILTFLYFFLNPLMILNKKNNKKIINIFLIEKNEI